MTDSAQNKAVSRRWIEVFNMRDDQAEAEVRAPEFVAHAPASLEPRPLTSEPWAGFLAGFVEGFPDVLITVEGAVGDGDLVAQRLRFEGTHKGVFQGLPPTGRRVTFSGLDLNRHGEDGRVLEHRFNWTRFRSFSSWVWSSYPVCGWCLGFWPTSRGGPSGGGDPLDLDPDRCTLQR